MTDILQIIHDKDASYELASIGAKYDLTGDNPFLFLQEIEKAYDLTLTAKG